MDGQRFDDLTKELATSSPRRHFLRSLALGVVGLGFSARGGQALAAPPDPKCKPLFHKCALNVECCSRFCDKNGKQCVCAPDEIACNNQCVATCHDVKDPCKVSFCDPLTGKCVVGNAPNGTVCEDGDLCTVGDTCQNGTCRPGPVKTCDQCLACDRATGACVPKPNGTSCDDGNKCTLDDTCQAGVCVPGRLKDCDDNNECTADTCDPATGNCVHMPLPGQPCETGNKCTADVCDDDGRCQQGPETVTCPQCQICDPGTGTCRNIANDTPCEDGDLCTVGDTCQDGTCRPGAVKTCDQCLECDSATGTCEPVANDTPCDDENPCTVNDTCQAGACVPGTAVTCEASTDPCKVNVCDPTNGRCVTVNAPNGTACEDGNLCTLNDTCQNGTCQSGSPKTCPASTDPCKVNVCNPATGQCAATQNAPNGTPCEDGDLCTLNDTCQNGTCQSGGPKTCPTSTELCKVNVCQPATGNCVAQPAPNNTPCAGTGSGRVCCGGQCCQGDRICSGGVCTKR